MPRPANSAHDDKIVNGLSRHQLSEPASFGIYGKPEFLYAISAFWAANFIFFALFPSVDIAISRLFYDAGSCATSAPCGGFPHAKSANYAALRSIFYAAPFLVLIAVFGVNSIIFIRRSIPFTRDIRVVSAVLLALLLGPGLLVNGVLKEFVLRVRPRDTLIFGGDFPFVPVGQWQGLCTGNCSFVSGEASIAPFMVLGIVLFSKTWQKPAMLVLLPLSFAMAFLRVVVGAHYFSDVVLGYTTTLVIFCLLAQAFIRFDKTPRN